jgi:hypothetical protein
MSLKDMLQASKLKTELEQAQKECDELRAVLADSERLQVHELKQEIARLEALKAKTTQDFEAERTKCAQEKRICEDQVAALNREIAAKRDDLIVLNDELLLQSFGLYKPRYNLQNSDAYKARLEAIRSQQVTMVKNGMAAVCPTNWMVNNSRVEGERMIRDYTKLIVRSFNNECDASIVNIKFNNVEPIEKKIRKAFDTLNNLGKRMSIAVTPDYLKLRLDELHLCYEYQVKKQEEKEEQRRLREEMREQAKVMREIEEMKLKIAKEEKHFSRAIETIDDQLEKAHTEAERELLLAEKAKIQEELAKIEKNRMDLQYREQNTRAGYVYVISNIGAFGENVFKIGVTRRLEPLERIDELGDSSVPFDFDVHALVFSEDAPALETALHKAFDKQKVNMVNQRREFFNVTLGEIEQVIKSNFSKPVEVTRIAEAAEYRQSLLLRGDGK